MEKRQADDAVFSSKCSSHEVQVRFQIFFGMLDRLLSLEGVSIKKI